MSELELISNDAVYSSQKQLSVDLKDNGIWGTKTADNEPEITFKRLFHAVFYILWDVVSTHNASVATSSKAEFLFSRNLGILGSLLENQPLTLKKLALEQSTTEVWITHTLLKTCKCDKTEVRPDNNWTLLSGFGCVCLVLCTYRLCEPWGML